MNTLKFLKQFLTKNFKPLFSENELGALGNVATTEQIKKEFGALPQFEITGDDLLGAFGNRTRAIDMVKDKPLPFQRGYTKLVKDPLKDFSMRGQVGALQQNPTLATDASVLQGKTIIPIVGDRTSRDVIITGIGDLDFDKPVRTFGGVQFMDDPNQGWASMMEAMKSFNKKVETVEEMGGKPVGMTTTMGERGGDFSLDTANVIIESLKVKKNTKKNLNEMTKIIKNQQYRKGEKTSQPFVKAPNLNNIDEFSKYLKEMPGTSRALLVKTLDKDALQKAGAPDIGQIRLALTNPGLYAEDWLGMGARFVDLDPKRGVLPSKHPSYDSQLMKASDAETYTFGTTIPHTIMLRKIMEERRKASKYGNFKPQSPDYKTLEMSPSNIEVVDQQLIDEASKYLEIKRTLGDEEAYKYAQSLIPAT